MNQALDYFSPVFHATLLFPVGKKIPSQHHLTRPMIFSWMCSREWHKHISATSDNQVKLTEKQSLWLAYAHRHTYILPRNSVIKVIKGIKYYLTCLMIYAFAHDRVNNLNHLGVEIVRTNSQCNLAKRFPLQWQVGLINSGCLGNHAEMQQDKECSLIMTEMASEMEVKIYDLCLFFYKVV